MLSMPIVLASEAVQALYSLVLVVFAGFAPYSLITHVNMVKNFLHFLQTGML